MFARRQFLLLSGAFLAGASARPAFAQAGMSHMTAYAFRFKGLDGGDIDLSAYAGRPILVVNTASRCGYTPQFVGLQTLWTRYRDRGLLVLAVPSNDFGGQEPGGPADIVRTAHQEYKVTFPIADKVAVKGRDAHPFYRWAAQELPQNAPRWNFHKYLVGRDGRLKAGFTSAVEPADPSVVVAIETELRA